MAQPIPAPSQRSQSSRWLLSVLPAFPDLLTIVDGRGVIDYVSPSVTALLGHHPELIVGRRACEFLPEEDLRNAAGWLRHAATHDEAPQFVHRLARSDHTFGWFESSVHRLGALRDGLVVVASRDIAARRLADSHLAASALMWRSAADVLVEAVLIVDAGGLIVAGIQSAAGLLGVPRETLVGKHIQDVLNVDASRAAILDERGFRACVPRADGRVRHVRGRARPLPDDAAGDGTDQASGRLAILIWPADEPPRQTPHDRPDPDEQSTDTAPALRHLLSPREIEVLRLLADGLDVRGVSTELGISIHTTRNYVKSVLHKLDARTQLQAVVIALRTGLVDLS